MTIARLARCTKLTPGDRYTCNCGADSQNERAAMLDRVEASDAAVHSHRVDDGSLETAATTERTFPRVSLSTVCLLYTSRAVNTPAWGRRSYWCRARAPR